MKGRKFGRTPKHRKALMRNLATQLIEHERITTTLEKAKELRPLMERLVHKARQQDAQGMRFLRQTLYTNAAIKKLTDEIAPRFKELPAGFTRVEFTGKRNVDKGNRAMIEIIGNPYAEFETNEDLVELEGSGLQHFWKWEMGLLEQEEEYWEDLLRNLEITIDEQIAQ